MTEEQEKKIEEYAKYKFIVYAKFSIEDDIHYPIMCENVSASKLLKDSLLLEGVLAMQDQSYKTFKINSVHVKHDNIFYLCSGEYDIEELKRLTEERNSQLNPDVSASEEVEDTTEEYSSTTTPTTTEEDSTTESTGE